MQKVSIIVPIYNAEKYLDICINSVINQTYENIEILLVNDGSKDTSGEICKKYAEKDKRIVVIRKENGGVSSARNLGLKKSKGDYILFLDSDDQIDLNTVNNLIDIQHNKDVDIIMFGGYFENTLLNRINTSYFKEEMFNSKEKILTILPILIKSEQMNSVWGKLYKSKIIKDNNICFEESINIAEDLLFNYQVFKKVNSLYISNKKFYHYMIRDDDSLTRGLNSNKYKMLIFVNDYMMKLTTENDIAYAEIKSAIKQIRVKNIYSCLLDMFHKNNLMSYSKKKNYIKSILLNENFSDYSDINSKLYKILILVLDTENISLIYFFILVIFRTKKIIYKLRTCKKFCVKSIKMLFFANNWNR